jgi:cyclic beta-1,2-glucan synthetase
MDPCIPKGWPGFQITFRYHSARYEIGVENPHAVSRGVSAVEVDGIALDRGTGIALIDDGTVHRVRIVLGAAG